MTVTADSGSVTMHEASRLERLYELQILDTPNEIVLDRLTRTAAHVANAPMAYISLIDRDRQWMKSKMNLDVSETPRSVAFCDHTIRTSEVLVVPDSLQDSRFRDSPLVHGSPGIRFYCGAPLMTPDGYGIGSLCVIDTQPRDHPSPAVITCMEDLAATAMDIMKMRLVIANQRSESIHQDTGRLRDYLRRMPMMTLMLTPGGRILEASERFCQMLNLDRTRVIGRPLSAFLTTESAQRFEADLADLYDTRKEFFDEGVELLNGSKEPVRATMSARAILGADGDVSQTLTVFVLA